MKKKLFELINNLKKIDYPTKKELFQTTSIVSIVTLLISISIVTIDSTISLIIKVVK